MADTKALLWVGLPLTWLLPLMGPVWLAGL
ncbi:hypothetical protein GALL_371310 [mine drainage metagenome]|uniref:Uncharacterized protein n=1 Tax=mine drainage metagenome TaxID=410659 RepID=A0A1J5QME5_9ZZZZ